MAYPKTCFRPSQKEDPLTVLVQLYTHNQNASLTVSQSLEFILICHCYSTAYPLVTFFRI